MEINDVRHINPVVTRHELKQGGVYIDEDGLYVMYTDEGSLISLSNGEVWEIEVNYNDSSEFIAVNAVLEIRS